MRRKIRRTALAFAAAYLGVLVLAPALGAEDPWWQILAGTRPTNMWEPTDNVQEVMVKNGTEGAAIIVSVKGKTIACLGAGNANKLCPGGAGSEISTAAQLEAVLEAAFGTALVQVSGGPVLKGSGLTTAFVITTPGRPVPVIAVSSSSSDPQKIKQGGSAEAKVLSGGGSGRLSLTITNIGDAPVDATETPVEIVDKLPEGVIATGVEAFAGTPSVPIPVDCALEGETKVTCSFEGELPSYEAIEIEIFATLTGEPPVAGAPGLITVSGGNALPKSETQEIKVSPEETPFGIEVFSMKTEEEGGGPVTRAGSHPFQQTTTIQFNAGEVLPGATRNQSKVEQPALPRNVRTSLPAGLVGSVAKMPACGIDDFFNGKVPNKCGPETAIGVASVTIIDPSLVGFRRIAVPVFNLVPAFGEPARFGFSVSPGVPILIDTAADPDNDYRIEAIVRNASQVVTFLSTSLVIWGTPGDSRHDSSRGWNCAYKFADLGPCEPPGGLGEEAFLREPVSCSAPRLFAIELEPWNVPLGTQVASSSDISPALSGCNQVPFTPTIASSPTTKLAGNPSGLDFRLDMPNDGLFEKDALAAEGQAKKVEVTLPEGMTINPSQGEGLVGCSPADLARETFNSAPGAGCPEASKVGEIQVQTPLVKEEARGSLYVASPFDNPFNSLIALYMVAKIPERGVLVKQAGVVRPDPKTGQLVTVFDDLPQIPFTTFRLHFREGGRAPLVTPPACGSYDIVARFTPWSAADPDNPTPEEIVTRKSTFQVERGVDGGACPGGGIPPFHPGLFAGTTNNSAGSYSPFNLRLTRKDGEQEFTNFSIKLPPGVTGKLAGLGTCSDAAIAAARARTGPNGGLEEIQSPSCPADSQVGRTLVGAGVGASLVYVPGKIYLAGAFNGAPLSIVAITAARVGPFDLGTVVIRQALRINPETAEVFVDPTSSDPIPHIIQGVPVHARDIRAYVDRPNFTLNPTNCEPTSTASTVLGSGLDFGSAADDQPVTVTSPFQAADCASLAFKPKLSLALLGGTKRGATPRLKAVLTVRKGDANIGRAQVTLPHSAFLEQAHIRTVCTRVQFKAGGGNGEQCPKGSIYGKATAITPLLDEPLKGNVYLRSSEHELPDLVAALHSSKVDFNLVGRIDSLNGRIRNTFEAAPDAPVTKFTLEMQGGKKGLITNSTDICRGKHRAIAAFKGQNGRLHEFKPAVGAQCGRKSAKGRNSR
jgi:hypothetical protein